MLYRLLSLVFVAVALAMFVGQSAAAGEKDKEHEGKVVKAGKGRLTMTMKGDEKKHTHDVAPKAKITLNGKTAKLEDLKEGFHIHVHMDDQHVVTSVRAHSKEKKE